MNPDRQSRIEALTSSPTGQITKATPLEDFSDQLLRDRTADLMGEVLAVTAENKALSQENRHVMEVLKREIPILVGRVVKQELFPLQSGLSTLSTASKEQTEAITSADLRTEDQHATIKVIAIISLIVWVAATVVAFIK